MTEARLPRHGRNHLLGGSDPIPHLGDFELAGYNLVTSGSSPQAQYTPYSLNSWTLEAGVALLNTTTDPSNATVLKDGIYTWHFHYRYNTGLAPQGSYAVYHAQFDFPLSTIPGPLFSDHGSVLPLLVYSTGIYPQGSNTYRLPMKAGDKLNSPFVTHNVPSTDPHASLLAGGDVELTLLWEPLLIPFPTI